MINFEMHGFDDLKHNLEELQRKAKELDGTHNVSFDELFPPAFMAKNTKHQTIDALVKASGFTINSKEDFKAIPDDQWDSYIQQNTRFSNWKEMQQTAANEYFARKLGLGS